MLASVESTKLQRRAVAAQYGKPDNGQGLTQVLTTVVPLILLWWAAIATNGISLWLSAAVVISISLFTLRVFVMMHDCGHGSLFRSSRLNRGFGFVFGVITGMPQYVWSQHHNYHHAHNGNWEKYRGPYTTLSTEQYAAMNSARRCLYRCKCSIFFAPVVGFIYLIFNPRVTWARGSIALLQHVLRMKFVQPDKSLKAHAASFRSRYWHSPREYWHMFWNNVVLLSLWVVLCRELGAGPFFSIYLISLSLAGAAGIVVFTVQHNFEHSYASDDERWDYDVGTIRGTSFLLLPRWLNWMILNGSYHHIHHLSARIPNYCLVKCHDEHPQLFSDVTRLRLAEIPRALKCILWDMRTQRIISIQEYERRM